MFAVYSRYWDPIRKLMDLPLALKALAGVLAILVDYDRLFAGAVVLLLFVDTVSGIMAAKRRGESITSNALRRGLPKFVDYVLAGTAATIAARGFPTVLYWLDGAVLLCIAMIEVLSILENTMSHRAPGLLKYIRGRFKLARLLDNPPKRKDKDDDASEQQQ